MNLDDRANRAADALRQRVEPEIDITAARASMGAGAAAHRARVNRFRVGGAVVAVAAVLGAVAFVGSGSGTSDETAGRVEANDGTSGIDANAAAILGAMPQGPMDGKESYKLPVLVEPQSDLADGDTVTVYGKGFDPNDALGIVQCSAEADVDGAGIGGCQLASTPPAGGQQLDLTPEQQQAIDEYLDALAQYTGTTASWDESEPLPEPPMPPIVEGDSDVTIPDDLEDLFQSYGPASMAWTEAGGEYPDSFGAVTYADADANGEVVAEFEVSRYISTPDGGEIDCMSAAERCIVGMGAISDYDRSGGSYIGFTGQPDFPEPSLSVEPAGDPAGTFAPGQAVTAKVAGWVSKRQIRISQCVGEQCQTLQDSKADDAGNADVAVTLPSTIVDEETGEQIACEDQCVLRANGIGTEGQTSAPLPDDIPLAFPSAEPGTPVTVPPPSSPETPTTPAPSPVPTTAPAGSATTLHPAGSPCNDPGAPTDCGEPVSADPCEGPTTVLPRPGCIPQNGAGD